MIVSTLMSFHSRHYMGLFTLKEFWINIRTLIFCPNFTILESIDFFTTLESYIVKTNQAFGSNHLPKSTHNSNKTYRNPSFDQWNFKSKFHPIPKTRQPK